MGSILPRFAEASWAVIEHFDPKRAFAICGYLFFSGFIFAMVGVANRYMLKRRLKKVEDMNPMFAQNGRGSTRAILWTIGFAFFLRSCWCMMKAFPYEPLACPFGAKQPGLPPGNSTKFGSLQYNIRETINRFGTMLYFTSYSIIAFFFARCCATAQTSSENAAGAAQHTEPTAQPSLAANSSISRTVSDGGEFIAERVQKHSVSRRLSLNSTASAPAKPKAPPTPFTCSQGIFLTLNLWLYISFAVFISVAWLNPTMDDPCHPKHPRITNSSADECPLHCKKDWFLLPFQEILCQPTWYFVHLVELVMVNVLFGILMIGVAYFGIRLFSIIMKRKTVNKSLRSIGYQILAIVIVCIVGFSTRIVLGLWTIIGLPFWDGWTCIVFRPYGQYLVAELLPGIVLIIFMLPDCTTIPPSHATHYRPGRERQSSLELPNSSRVHLIDSNMSLATYGSMTSIDDEAERLAGVEC